MQSPVILVVNDDAAGAAAAHRPAMSIALGRLAVIAAVGLLPLLLALAPGRHVVWAAWDARHPATVRLTGAVVLHREPPLDGRCPLLGALERGRVVQVVQRTATGWAQITAIESGTVWTPDGPWLPPDGAPPTPLAAPAAAYAAPPPDGACHVVLGVADAGEAARVLRRGPAWTLVRVGGRQAWIPTAALPPVP